MDMAFVSYFTVDAARSDSTVSFRSNRTHMPQWRLQLLEILEIKNGGTCSPAASALARRRDASRLDRAKRAFFWIGKCRFDGSFDNLSHAAGQVFTQIKLLIFH